MRCKQCKVKIEKGKEIIDGINVFCSKSDKLAYNREQIRKQKEKQAKIVKKEKLVAKKKEKREKKIKAKRESVSFLIKKLDAIFSRYIRVRDAIKTTGTKTHLKCYTCDEVIEVTKAHNMHFIPRGHKKHRFSESNTRGGCMRCNVLMHGNYIEYFTRLEKEIGRDEIDKMIQSKNEITKYEPGELIDLILEYTVKLAELESK